MKDSGERRDEETEERRRVREEETQTERRLWGDI